MIYLPIAAFILGVVGTTGTYYQILESQIIWIIFLVLGFTILLTLLFFYKKGNDESKKKIEEQEADINSMKEKIEEQVVSIKHLEEATRHTGIDHVYQNQKDAEGQIINECDTSKMVKILAVRAQHLLGSKHSLFWSTLTSKLQKGTVGIQLLLLDPTGENVTRRADEISEDSELFAKMIEYTIDLVDGLKKTYGENIVYRLYDQLPTFRLFIFEKKLFLSFYLNKIEGQETQVYEIGSSSQIYCAYDRYFDYLFEPKERGSMRKLDDF